MEYLLLSKIGIAIIPLLIAFGVAAVIAPVLIPWLHRLKFGQQILEDGPSWHKNKQGTPTMGGFIFMAGVAVAAIVALFVKFDVHLLMLLLVSLGFGAVGFIDDYIKVIKKRNLGLVAWQKLILQSALAIVYVFVLNKMGNLSTDIVIPFMDKTISIPWWLYIPFILFVVVGTVNSVNLTDGLDGLAASITVVVAVFFGIVAFLLDNDAICFFASSLVGGLIAFLIFNHYPAKVFMGDTGSLFLGGAISVMAVGLKMPLILVIAGFVYLFEALSVIIQVSVFQITGKRVFKMSPIHHHFEMCGWKENKIVVVFSLITLVLCVFGFFALTGYIQM